jgi:hypothetical protein
VLYLGRKKAINLRTGMVAQACKSYLLGRQRSGGLQFMSSQANKKKKEKNSQDHLNQ